MYYDNKRRDRTNGAIDERRGAEAGMLDVTEVSLLTMRDMIFERCLTTLYFENPDFRYVL